MNKPSDVTLRDYFAGMFMQRVILEGDLDGETEETVCKKVAFMSYKVADFMIQARSNNGQT